MRYFTTEAKDFLFWRLDEETGVMQYTGHPESGVWETYLEGEAGSTPETLNTDGFGDEIPEGNPMFAFETDENWNRL